MRISDWSSDVCSSDLLPPATGRRAGCRGAAAGGCQRPPTPCPPACAEWWTCQRPKALRQAIWFLVSSAYQPSPLSELSRPKVFMANSTFIGAELSLGAIRSEEHTSELQSLMRISYAVFCLKKKKTK